MERNAERELLPMTKSLDLAFTAWGALGSGVLTGKYNDDPTGGGGPNRLSRIGVSERNLAIASEAVSPTAGEWLSVCSRA